eukprot:gb/GECH01008867.1/.p1 GENE.gb/GECH01008867.1/~~gb/GECH01008867.1/.p1  ORF type:complete len:602 (+),score=87.51 gb/GECH01008867.1/:1-1806(+)
MPAQLHPVPDDTNTLLTIFCSSCNLVPQSLPVFRKLFLQTRFLVRQGSTQSTNSNLKIIYKYLFEIQNETLETLQSCIDSLESMHFSKKKENQKQSLSYLRQMETSIDGLLCLALSLYFRKQHGQCTADEMIQFRNLSKRVFTYLPSTLIHSHLNLDDIFNYYIRHDSSSASRDTPLRRSESLFFPSNRILPTHGTHKQPLTDLMFFTFLSSCIWLSLGPLDFLVKLRRTFGFVPYAAVGSAAAFLVMQQPLIAAGCAVGMCLLVFMLASGGDEDLPADLNALLSGHVDLRDVLPRAQYSSESDVPHQNQFNSGNQYSTNPRLNSMPLRYNNVREKSNSFSRYNSDSNYGNWNHLYSKRYNFESHANSFLVNLSSLIKSGITHKLSEMFPLLYLMQISHTGGIVDRFRSLPQWSEFLSTQLTEQSFSFSKSSNTSNGPLSNMNSSIFSSLSSLFKIWKQNPAAFSNPSQTLITMLTKFKDPLLSILNRSTNSDTQYSESEESISEKFMPEITSIISGMLSTIVTQMPAVWIPSENIHRLLGSFLNTFFYNLRTSSIRYRVALLVQTERIILEENSSISSLSNSRSPRNMAITFFQNITSRL